MGTFRLAQIFSDHCVLQRNKSIAVFGTGENGCILRIALMDGRNILAETKTVVSENKFLAELPPQKAGEGYRLWIGCEQEHIEFVDVAVGEVWLAGGQSNMELELRTMKDGYEFLRQEKNSKVRFYYTQKNSYKDPLFYEQESRTHWACFDEKESENWSAVAYLAARELSEKLKVTVGVISCNWGGTSASCWMSRKRLERDVELRSYVEEYERAIVGISEQEQVRAYDRYVEEFAVWDQNCAKLYANRPDITWEEVQEILGTCPYPGPLNCKSPFRPAGLYECMLQRVMPYTLCGFWYYQGESDDHKPRMYERLFSELIAQWREDFGKGDCLPFIFVQLPMHRYQADPDRKNWCLIREAQMKVYQTIKNTGIAVAIDCGEFNEIHPKDKREVAHRMALQSLFHVYQKDYPISASECFGPLYESRVLHEEFITVFCQYAQKGFAVSLSQQASWEDQKASCGMDEEGKQQTVLLEDLSGFEIAGADRRFVPARATLAKDAIRVSSPLVKMPKYVRYLWTNYGDVRIFGKNGLPLAPFRTDEGDEG